MCLVEAENEVLGQGKNVIPPVSEGWHLEREHVESVVEIGSENFLLQCTVNVKNEQDEAFLGFLESEAFQSGLKLATIAQPAIAPLSQLALGLTKSIAKRNRNVPVQEFSMGLDFASNPFGARLAEGDYIAVQIPMKMRTIWSWEEWVYDPRTGEIVNIDDRNLLIPYNYLVFSISRYHET